MPKKGFYQSGTITESLSTVYAQTERRGVAGGTAKADAHN